MRAACPNVSERVCASFSVALNPQPADRGVVYPDRDRLALLPRGLCDTLLFAPDITLVFGVWVSAPSQISEGNLSKIERGKFPGRFSGRLSQVSRGTPSIRTSLANAKSSSKRRAFLSNRALRSGQTSPASMPRGVSRKSALSCRRSGPLSAQLR